MQDAGKVIEDRFYILKKYKEHPLLRGCTKESVDKPGSVENGHSSATPVTRRL